MSYRAELRAGGLWYAHEWRLKTKDEAEAVALGLFLRADFATDWRVTGSPDPVTHAATDDGIVKGIREFS